MAETSNQNPPENATPSTPLSREDADKLALRELWEGKAALKEKQLDKAIEHFGTALKTKVAAYSDMSFECADYYHQYGAALLQYIQENADIFGNEKLKKKLESNEDGSDNEEDGDAEDEDDDLTLAWQNLDTARVLYANYLKEQSFDLAAREKLGIIHMALGDLSVESENFDQAVEEYNRSLEYIPENDFKRRADIHVQISVALLYGNRAEEALPHYEGASKMLTGHVTKLKDDISLSQDILDDLNERIAEIKDQSNIREALASVLPTTSSAATDNGASTSTSRPQTVTVSKGKNSNTAVFGPASTAAGSGGLAAFNPFGDTPPPKKIDIDISKAFSAAVNSGTFSLQPGASGSSANDGRAAAPAAVNVLMPKKRIAPVLLNATNTASTATKAEETVKPTGDGATSTEQQATAVNAKRKHEEVTQSPEKAESSERNTRAKVE